jgi:hypothetical protein
MALKKHLKFNTAASYFLCALASWWLSPRLSWGYGKHVPQVYRILRYKCTAKYRIVPQNVLREMRRNR